MIASPRFENLFLRTKAVMRTRPIFHSSDAAIRGHVFCSFLALVMQKSDTWNQSRTRVTCGSGNIVPEWKSQCCADLPLAGAAAPQPPTRHSRPGGRTGWNGAKLSFRAHPHMLRRACGYALANRGHDTRALQAYLGHRNIQHTVRYTEMSPTRFKNFWRD